MLPGPMPYEALYAGFRWEVPERFNIARAICDRWADEEPDRLALIHVSRDGQVSRLSYGDLQRLANRLANLLVKKGIQKGDRVALLLPQSPETAFAHIAISKIGAVALPLAMLFGPDAIAYRLENSGAKAVITTREGMTKLGEMATRPPTLAHVFSIDGAEGDVIDLHEAIAREEETFETADTLAEDPAVMVYTSGTTGPPKGALHAQRVLIGHLPGVSFTHEFFPKAGDIMWTPADWAWAGGLFNILWPALYFGVPVVAYDFRKFDPETAFALMAEHKVRNTFLPPTALKMLRTVDRPSERFDLALRTIGSGGESLGREVHEWGQEALGLSINEFYGQTECNLVLSSCGAIGVFRPGAIGKAVPGHTVAIIDDKGNVLPPGEPGQIAIRRPDPVMFLEYWGRPEATRDKFIGDWMTTGDQGMMDEEGYVFFQGRDDDIITSAGFRIGPGEIEDCLLGHPAVAMAAVVGKPDPVRTEIVKAFLVLNPGYEPSEELEEEIRTYVRTRLSAHEYPREIAFVPDLPLTTTGKVIRRLLREQA